MKTKKLTEEEYDEIKKNLLKWVKNECLYCKDRHPGCGTFEFLPYGEFDGTIRRQCTHCGYIESFNPKYAADVREYTHS